jgi:hypothetical protein
VALPYRHALGPPELSDPLRCSRLSCDGMNPYISEQRCAPSKGISTHTSRSNTAGNRKGHSRHLTLLGQLCVLIPALPSNVFRQYTAPCPLLLRAPYANLHIHFPCMYLASGVAKLSRELKYGDRCGHRHSSLPRIDRSVTACAGM